MLSALCHNLSKKRSHLIRSSCSHYCGIQGIEKPAFKITTEKIIILSCNCLSSFSSLASSRLWPALNLQADLQKVEITENVWSVYKDFQAILEPLSFGFFDTPWPSPTPSGWTYPSGRVRMKDLAVLQAIVAGSSAPIPYFVYSVWCLWNIMQEYATNPRRLLQSSYQQGSWQHSCLDVSWRLTDKDVWNK